MKMAEEGNICVGSFYQQLILMLYEAVLPRSGRAWARFNVWMLSLCISSLLIIHLTTIPHNTLQHTTTLQGLSTSASLFMESAVGVDDDETSFLLSTLWDKMRVQKSLRTMPLSSLSQGLLGVLSLRDPIGNNIREFLYEKVSGYGGKAGEEALRTDMRNEDVITTGMRYIEMLY
jgi:hypothetical protein